MAEILLKFVLDTIQSINHYSDGFISFFLVFVGDRKSTTPAKTK